MTIPRWWPSAALVVLAVGLAVLIPRVDRTRGLQVDEALLPPQLLRRCERVWVPVPIEPELVACAGACAGAGGGQARACASVAARAGAPQHGTAWDDVACRNLVLWGVRNQPGVLAFPSQLHVTGSKPGDAGWKKQGEGVVPRRVCSQGHHDGWNATDPSCADFVRDLGRAAPGDVSVWASSVQLDPCAE